MRFAWWMGLVTLPSSVMLMHGCSCTTPNVFDMPSSVKGVRLEGEACESPSVTCDKGGGGRAAACYVGGKGECVLHIDFDDGSKERLPITYTAAEGCDPCTISSVGDDAVVRVANARLDAGADARAASDAAPD
jgi:hypothetical protein